MKVFAGIVTERKKEWDLSSQSENEVAHLSNTNSYMNLKVLSVVEDELRPKSYATFITRNLRPFMDSIELSFRLLN